MHAYLYRRELQHVRCLCPRQEVVVDESLSTELKEIMCVHGYECMESGTGHDTREDSS